MSMFHYFAKNGYIDELTICVKAGVDINSITTDKCLDEVAESTGLHIAVLNNKIEIV